MANFIDAKYSSNGKYDKYETLPSHLFLCSNDIQGMLSIIESSFNVDLPFVKNKRHNRLKEILEIKLNKEDKEKNIKDRIYL